MFRRSLHLRHVDAGSCNACESEIGQLFSPAYDAQQQGIDLVASPRHADGILVTGPVSRGMQEALLRTLEAVPAPKRVLAVGDCAIHCGHFTEGSLAGPLERLVPVDASIPGCPPTPEQILLGIRSLMQRSGKGIPRKPPRP